MGAPKRRPSYNFKRSSRPSSQQEKLIIEQLRKAIQERINKDPKAAKKAAMILEKMLK